MKTKLFLFFLITALVINGCKPEFEQSIIAGNYYSDCFSESPLKNRKLTLIYYTSRNRLGGVIAETTTDANGYFKFIYEKKDKYYKIKIEDFDPVLNGKTIVESMSKFPDRTKMKVYYQNQGKLIYTTNFKNTYTNDDTLYYTYPSTVGTFARVGPFEKNQKIDSLLFGLEGSGFKMVWGIGYADFRKNFQSYDCYRCIPIENVACGERTIIKMTE